MKITIETSCKEDTKWVIYHVGKFCKENFRQSKVFIDEKLEHEHDWRDDEEKRDDQKKE